MLEGTAGVGLVDADCAGTLGFDAQSDGLDIGPAAPVAGRERVEVGAEGQPLSGAGDGAGTGQEVLDVYLAARRGRLGALRGGRLHHGAVHGVELRAHGGAAVDVQQGCVHLALIRENYPLQGVPLRGFPGCALLLFRLQLAHASTPPLSSFAPPVKWGLILLSYIDNAEPIAMCMSRYL